MHNKVIYWFRKDLRLDDNRCLNDACAHAKEILFIYCFDDKASESTEIAYSGTGEIRKQFIAESLYDLKKSLQNKGNDLLIFNGKAEEILSHILNVWNADALYYQKEYATYEVNEEDNIEENIESPITIYAYHGSTLIHPDDLPFNIEKTPNIFTDFRNQVERNWKIRKCVPPPAIIPPAPDFTADLFVSKKIMNNLNIKQYQQNQLFHYQGGEYAALKRLKYYLDESHHISRYKETRNQMMGSDYSSRFSAWLSLGCISPRRIYEQIKKYESEHIKNESTYWLIFELLWRDFFRFICMKYENDFFKKGGIQLREITCKKDNDSFEKWRTGNTGQPFIDACMKELLYTGYMSNRGRQNVASFLVNDLELDWRWGARWFEHQLIDEDVYINWGNWMYLAGVGNDPVKNRKFNIEKQAEIHDPEKAYQHFWLNYFPDDK
jgi:deoxyribodipyrimidine photo-lyase